MWELRGDVSGIVIFGAHATSDFCNGASGNEGQGVTEFDAVDVCIVL
jgi:hypothetical protein